MHRIKLPVILGLLLLLALAWWLFGPAADPLHPLPAREAGAVEVEVTLEPPQPRAGERSQLGFTLREDGGAVMTDLMPHHARRLHVLIVGEDLASLGHLHPADFPELQTAAADEHRIGYRFPRAGRYLLAVDAMQRMQPLRRQFLLTVAGGQRMGLPARDFSLRQCLRGIPEDGPDRYVEPVLLDEWRGDCRQDYAIELQPPAEVLKAGEGLRFKLQVALAGEPVTDLAPYLEAAAHLAIVPERFDRLLHEHAMATNMPPEEYSKHAAMGHHMPPPAAFGPEVWTEGIVFPEPGRWKMFVQLKHAGRLLVTAFMLQIEEGFADADADIVELALKDGELQPSTLRFTKDQPVVLRIASDTATDFHLHGYALERRLSADAVTEIRFTARLTGRYPMEGHLPDGSTQDFGVIEVYPR